MELDLAVPSTDLPPSTKSQTKRKRALKRKHKDIDSNDSSVVARLNGETAVETTVLRSVEADGPQCKKRKNKTTSWKVSEPVGGVFEDLLPIFSTDEEHLLLAQRNGINVYSTATSTLVRTCTVGSAKVSSFCLSSTSNKLYVLLSDGKIQSWDWTNGNKLKSWDLGAQVSDIAVSALKEAEDVIDVVYTTEFRKGASSVTAHMLEGSIPAVKVLYRSKDIIRAIKILNRGEYIVAITSSSIIVGKRTTDTATKVKQLQYVFKTLETQETITCYDARVTSSENNNNASQGGLDIVAGLQNGSITAFYDTMPTNTNEQRIPLNQKLHWHRDAVGSVAWSPDGNYLLSGGRETVLVIWQLDTGTKNTLPHLTSSVEGVVVSPKRTSYAIRLADNSTMILAIADMIPTFNVASVSLPSRWTGEDKTWTNHLPRRRAPIASIEARTPIMLSAVSSDTYRGQHKVGSYSNTILLSMPLSSLTTSVTRQALIDDNATTIRQRPDGRQLVSPNVVLMATSKDGGWLVTVDEWYPPLADFLFSSVGQDEALLKRAAAAEINMTFWECDGRTETWVRSTRVPNPHADVEDASQPAGVVLDIIAESKDASFWTLGTDGTVKQWSLRKRSAIGSRATTTPNTQENVWRCVRNIPVPAIDSNTLHTIFASQLTIAKDSTVLVITIIDSSGSKVDVLAIKDVGASSPVLSIQVQHKKVSVALLNQYLVVADQESLIVRNLIDSEDWYETRLSTEIPSFEDQVQPLLAIDQERRLIAISIPRKSKRASIAKSKKSKIMIFSPKSDKPVAMLDHQPTTAAMLHAQNKFYALTGGAEIYAISENLTSEIFDGTALDIVVSDQEASASVQQNSGLGNIFGSGPPKISKNNEDHMVSTQNNAIQKSIAWENLSELNLEQPFNLPKTSAIQMMSMMVVQA